MRKKRSYAEVYNDMDSEIVNLFRVARDHGDELRRVIELTPFARAEFNLAYLPSDDPIEQARRTMVRAGMAVGSTGASCRHRTGFRADAKKRGTHPAMDWSRTGPNLEAIMERLRGVIIENRTAAEVLLAHDSAETLHFVDPPYVASTRAHNRGKGAYRFEMTDDDHARLAETLQGLRGSVIVCGYPSELYEELYSGWNRVEAATWTHGAHGSVRRTEVLWMKGNRAHPELFR
jgi:DNA adenine methylase